MITKNCNNVKFKAQYLIDHMNILPRKTKIPTKSKKIIELMKRDGAKCKCCNKDVHFNIVDSVLSLYTYDDVDNKMTIDHNLLASLGGDVDESNINALCLKCNSLRGNNFAEFNEFKQWYDKFISKSITNNDISNEKNNFSYIEFERNFKSFSLSSKYLPNKIPLSIQRKIEHDCIYHNNISFIDVPLKVLQNFSTDSWNLLLNKIIKIIMKNRHSIEINNNIDFDMSSLFIKVKSSTKFSNLLENKIQTTISELKKQYKYIP